MRILIVEDHEKLAVALKEGLTQEGYAVDCLNNGSVAKVRLESHPNDYDLIILDIMLPGLDGIRLCKALREDNNMVPVIILTAKNGTEDKIDGLNSGADDYMVKPFSFNELAARIRALLRRPTVSAPTELRIGDIVMSSETRKVFFKNKELSLTLKEFALFELLMHHPNQVLTRQYLLNHVWNFDFDSTSNILTVHIKNLRKKLKVFGNKKTLETIRGIGYRLNE